MTFIRKLLGLPEKSDNDRKCFTRINEITHTDVFAGHSMTLDRDTGEATCIHCGITIVNTLDHWDEIIKENDECGMAIIPR